VPRQKLHGVLRVWRHILKRGKMVLITLTLVSLAVGLLYAVLIWNYDYWRKRGVPGPKPKLLCGNYPHMFTLKRHAIYDLNDIYR